MKNGQIMRHATSFSGYEFRAGRELSRAFTAIHGLPRIQKGLTMNWTMNSMMSLVLMRTTKLLLVIR